MRHKPLGSQLGTVQVTTRQARTTHANFANHSGGYGLVQCVENEHLSVGNWATNWNASHFELCRRLVIRRVGTNFRRAIQVDQVSFTQTLSEPLDQCD